MPWRYKWSSAAAHTGEDDRSPLVDLSKWFKMIPAKQWHRELVAGLEQKEINAIRLRTHTGRPLGTDNFISKVEKLLGRRVRPLPIGRPKKRSAKG
jgi:putative transposase